MRQSLNSITQVAVLILILLPLSPGGCAEVRPSLTLAFIRKYNCFTKLHYQNVLLKFFWHRCLKRLLRCRLNSQFLF